MSTNPSISLAVILALLAGSSIAAAQPAPPTSPTPATPPTSPTPATPPTPQTPPTPTPTSSTAALRDFEDSSPAPVAVTATARTGDEPAWSLAIAPRMGVTVPTSKLGPMVVVGFELDYALPVAHRQLVVALDAALTRPGHDGTVMDARIPGGMGTYSIHQLEMVVGIMASYRVFPAGHRVVPWFGAGPILHLLKTTEASSLAPADNTATSTELGIELGGGVDYRVGPGFLVGDVRIVYSKLDNLLTGASNAGNIVLAAGYRFVF